MRFLIAGFGSIGRRHLRNLRACGQNDLVLLRSNHSTLPTDEIGDIPVETEINKAMAHHPDGVIIANPTAFHLDVAIPAAKAGCSILMEKPITDQIEKIGELESALKAGNGKLLMGFQFRFHPGLIKIKELMQTGAIGRPLSFQACWSEYLPDWHPWEDYRKSYSARKDLGGGVALTLCHPFDYVRWLFGEVDFIWGYNGKISDLEISVDDVAEVGVKMENNLVGSIHLDYFRRFVRNDLEITGTQGVLHWNNSDACVTLQNAVYPESVIIPPAEPFERNQLFLEEMKHFIAVTKREVEPSCTLHDGLITEQLINAVKRSWDEKRIIDFKKEQNLG